MSAIRLGYTTVLFWSKVKKWTVEEFKNNLDFFKTNFLFIGLPSSQVFLIEELYIKMWTRLYKTLMSSIISVSFSYFESSKQMSCCDNFWFVLKTLIDSLLFKIWLFDFRVKIIYTTAPAASKNDAQFKSGQNWLKNK